MEAIVVLIEVLVVSALCAEEPIENAAGRCIRPLGMEEGKIPDDAITASSSYETKSVGPQNARIRQEKDGGAWCPKAQISSDVREYLEIDLTRDHLITWTETQGRFGNGQGQEYAETFFLEYWRDVKWRQYKNSKGDRVLRGNSNTYLVEKQKLDLPFVASRVRFVPYSQHPRTVCMRVEIYGCVWEQRIARYTAPKGEIFGPNGLSVEDSSYDGVERSGLLLDGLGQLTDGIFGQDPNTLETGTTDWVGWRDVETVEIVFEFQQVREFDKCSVHVARLPGRDAEVFAEARVWFSFDGKQYHPVPEKLRVLGESKASTSLQTIALQSRIGRFVRVELRPRSEWLLVSEITFESTTNTRNLSDDSPDRFFRACRDKNETVPSADVERSSSSGYNETIFELNADLTPDAFPVNNSQTYIGLASGALTVVALLLTCTVFLMKQRGRNKVALLQKHTALLCGSPAPGITINMKDVKLATPVVVNGSFQSRSSVKSKTFSTDDRSVRSGEHAAGSEYEQCSIYERTYKLFSDDDFGYEPRTRKSDHFSSCKTDYSDFTSERSFEDETIADREESASASRPVKRHNNHVPSKANHEVYEGYYAATDILTIKRREQHSATSLFTSLDIRDDVNPASGSNSYNVQHISRHRLRILDKLGEGSFGLVHLCEAKGILSPDIGTVRNKQVVIVRSLWRGVTDSLRKDFMKDMRTLATIRDVNIARVVAVVEEEPFGAVFEYGELGDLPGFVRNREKTGDNPTLLSDKCLLNLFAQIASGMKCLENRNIPHRDLAARNCIVCKNLTIKVSDHAMYCNKYDREYYMNENYVKVPLRWMAWEAVLLGKQTCRADAWSYAITVWEILMNCEEMPYADLTSEQVLENSSRWLHGGSSDETPPCVPSQPPSCSRDLYRMMIKCWSKRAEDRPTFEEMHLFLKRLSFD